MLTEKEEARRMELYKQGLSDAAIGRAVFVAPETIWRWRQKHGLKANCPRGNPCRMSPAESMEDA